MEKSDKNSVFCYPPPFLEVLYCKRFLKMCPVTTGSEQKLSKHIGHIQWIEEQYI